MTKLRSLLGMRPRGRLVVVDLPKLPVDLYWNASVIADILDGRRLLADLIPVDSTLTAFSVHSFYVSLFQAMANRHRSTITELNQQRTAYELKLHQDKATMS